MTRDELIKMARKYESKAADARLENDEEKTIEFSRIANDYWLQAGYISDIESEK